MLETIELSTWSDFEKTVANQTENQNFGPKIYRGHPDNSWRLETTLERNMGSNVPVLSYYYQIKNVQSQLETFTDHSWDLPSFEQFSKEVRDDGRVILEPILSYMQYLRHFGYPSPLLDWTYSPFIAAYFAFREVANKSKCIAIYELLAGGATWGNVFASTEILQEKPVIYPIAIPSQKNKRHYLQQSVYTVCLQRLDQELHYASHEDPNIKSLDNDHDTDGVTIKKYVIPTDERMAALQSLESYNINAYSLMGTEESLLESLFLQTYTVRQLRKNIFHDIYGLGLYTKRRRK